MRLRQGIHIYDYNNILDFKFNDTCVIFNGWCHSPKFDDYEMKAEIIYNDDKNSGYINFELIFNDFIKIDILEDNVIEDENNILIYYNEELEKIWYDKKNSKYIGQSFNTPKTKLKINFIIDNDPKPIAMPNNYGKDILYYQKVKRTFIFDRSIYDIFNSFIILSHFYKFFGKGFGPRWLGIVGTKYIGVLENVCKDELDEIYKYHELF